MHDPKQKPYVPFEAKPIEVPQAVLYRLANSPLTLHELVRDASGRPVAARFGPSTLHDYKRIDYTFDLTIDQIHECSRYLFDQRGRNRDLCEQNMVMLNEAQDQICKALGVKPVNVSAGYTLSPSRAILPRSRFRPSFT